MGHRAGGVVFTIHLSKQLAAGHGQRLGRRQIRWPLCNPGSGRHRVAIHRRPGQTQAKGTLCAGLMLLVEAQVGWHAPVLPLGVRPRVTARRELRASLSSSPRGGAQRRTAVPSWGHSNVHGEQDATLQPQAVLFTLSCRQMGHERSRQAPPQVRGLTRCVRDLQLPVRSTTANAVQSIKVHSCFSRHAQQATASNNSSSSQLCGAKQQTNTSINGGNRSASHDWQPNASIFNNPQHIRLLT